MKQGEPELQSKVTPLMAKLYQSGKLPCNDAYTDFVPQENFKTGPKVEEVD
jgi:hypothetical protein